MDYFVECKGVYNGDRISKKYLVCATDMLEALKLAMKCAKIDGIDIDMMKWSVSEY